MYAIRSYYEILVTGSAGFIGFHTSRITSYNVCYTKLLRKRALACNLVCACALDAHKNIKDIANRFLFIRFYLTIQSCPLFLRPSHKLVKLPLLLSLIIKRYNVPIPETSLFLTSTG